MPFFNVSAAVYDLVEADSAEAARARLLAALTAAGFEILDMPELHAAGGPLETHEFEPIEEPVYILPGEPGHPVQFIAATDYDALKRDATGVVAP